MITSIDTSAWLFDDDPNVRKSAVSALETFGMQSESIIVAV